MNKLILYFLFLLIVLISCSKTKSVPDPSVELTFGTLTSGTYITFIPFKNQDTIELSQLDTIKYIGIKISEMHLDSSYFVNTQRKPIFNVDINSSRDIEHYLSGSNCILGGWGGSKNSGNIDCSIDGEIEFPVRISKNPTPKNDTLEFNEGNDYIVISYLSVYSKLQVKDSLIVYKR
jgi:hypothetical protein